MYCTTVTVTIQTSGNGKKVYTISIVFVLLRLTSQQFVLQTLTKICTVTNRTSGNGKKYL